MDGGGTEAVTVCSRWSSGQMDGCRKPMKGCCELSGKVSPRPWKDGWRKRDDNPSALPIGVV